MKITFSTKFTSKKGSILVTPYFEKPSTNSFISKELQDQLKSETFKNKKGETYFFYDKKLKTNILTYNLGKKKTDLTVIKRAFSSIVQLTQAKKITDLQIDLNIINDQKELGATQDGLILGEYYFDKYISKPEISRIKSITLIKNKWDKTIQKSLDTDANITSNANFTRNLVNDMAHFIHPDKVVSEAKKIAKEGKLKIKILGEKEIIKEELGLLHAVSKGSKHPPYLFIAEYKGNPQSKEKTALIGKGITFDTGGLNLKPSNYIEDMRTDMGGAATVIGIMKTVTELKPKKNLIFVIPTCENAIGENAYKPGDVFKAYDGTTVEIMNTDAEGRLILADAISYAKKHYKPTKIMTFATLTGSVVVALGHEMCGILGNDEKNIKDIQRLGTDLSEFCWQLPLHEDYKSCLKSEFADIKNLDTDRYSGTIKAAIFLEHFIGKEKIKWIHFDIAGVAYFPKPQYGYRKGATGFGVRLLSHFLKG